MAAYWLYLNLQERGRLGLFFQSKCETQEVKETGEKELGKQMCWVLT